MTWVHKPLESPRLYNLVQRALGAGGRPLDGVYHRSFGASRGRVLDIGCGPIQETPLPAGTLIGLDVNPRYVARYVAGGAAADIPVRGVVGSAASLPFADATFDECRSVMVFHHLPDDLVRGTLTEMERVLDPGGTLTILDMVRPPSLASGPLAWLLCAADRGRHVRTADRLRRLVERRLPGTWSVETFLYAWPRLQGMVLTRVGRTAAGR